MNTASIALIACPPEATACESIARGGSFPPCTRLLSSSLWSVSRCGLLRSYSTTFWLTSAVMKKTQHPPSPTRKSLNARFSRTDREGTVAEESKRGLKMVISENKRLQVIRWLSETPIVALCTDCKKQFKTPSLYLNKTAEAELNLRRQFEQHFCEHARDDWKKG